MSNLRHSRRKIFSSIIVIASITLVAACNEQQNSRQVCIPVGCVPAARRLYAGVCFPVCVCVCLLQGGGIPACTEAEPPHCEHNDRHV